MACSISSRKSWLASGLLGLLTATRVSGAAISLNARDDGDDGPFFGLPPDLLPDDKGVCLMPWGRGDELEDRTTWIQSGASVYLRNYLDDHGVLNWSRDLLTLTSAKGSQGGTQFSCVDIDKSKCGPPQDCLNYEPVEAFYIHVQMNNLFTALQKLQSLHIKDSVSAIASDMYDIANSFGVVQDSGSKEIFNALLGVVGSLTGISGSIGAVAGGPAVGIANGMLGSLSAVVGYAKESSPKTAEAVQGAITNSYGKMFVQAMSQINDTVKVIYGENSGESFGFNRKRFKPAGEGIAQVRADYVYNFFQDGFWLDDSLSNSVINAYAKNTQTKMLELSLIQALKENEYPYYLHISPEIKGDFWHNEVSPDTCNAKSNCHWYDNHCLCLTQIGVGGFVPAPYQDVGGDTIEKIKKYTQNFNEALENNYNCVKDLGINPDNPVEAGPRQDPPPFDPKTLPPNYSGCFWNLGGVGRLSADA